MGLKVRGIGFFSHFLNVKCILAGMLYSFLETQSCAFDSAMLHKCGFEIFEIALVGVKNIEKNVYVSSFINGSRVSIRESGWMIPSYQQFSDSIWSTGKGHLGARLCPEDSSQDGEGYWYLVIERREERAVDASR